MSDCCCNPDPSGVVHVHSFLDLNGIPYVHGEYVDRNHLRQIDRSMIRSEVTVRHEPGARSIVDVAVDDIGKRASDGLPDIIGNNTKYQKLLGMIHAHGEQLDHILDVVRAGILVTVLYRLEDASTGYVIGSYSDDFRISRRDYYLDINPRNVNDNGIITNFSDTMVTTVNEFVHGHRKLNMRLMGVDISYELLTRAPKDLGRPNSMTRPPANALPTCYGSELDYYNVHSQLQSQHVMGSPGCTGCDDFGYGHNPAGCYQPTAWSNFNRFYHFDNNGRTLVLHNQEINDPRCKTTRIPCGRVRVNRLFPVQPGARIVFRFSVWKNDITLVNETTELAKALNAPMGSTWGTQCDCGCGSEIYPDAEHTMQLLHTALAAVNKQNYVINKIGGQMDYIQSQLEALNRPHICDHDCGCHTPTPEGPASVCGQNFKTIQDAIDAIQDGKVKGELTLMDDAEEELVISGDVTINLNGHTISAPKRIDTKAYHHTIMVDGGNLVINGEGEILNYNNQGYTVINLGPNDTWVADYEPKSMGEGTVTLNGGRFYHAADDKEHHGYVIVNHGARMTINEGVEVDTAYDDSSLVCNGFQKNPNSQPIMFINGGKFRGGRHTINNDHGGRIVITGGVFTMGTPWPEVDFASGPKNVFRNEEDSMAQIRGGKFTGNIENTCTEEKSLQITGGVFTVDVKAYVPEGYQQHVNGTVIKL